MQTFQIRSRNFYVFLINVNTVRSFDVSDAVPNTAKKNYVVTRPFVDHQPGNMDMNLSLFWVALSW